MNTCTSIDDLHSALTAYWHDNTTIGLVPTMGALHEGHLSLVRLAAARDELVVVSIFVNPTQFGPRDDLARYPRSPARDRTLLAAEDVDVVFMPSAEEMYPEGFATRVEVGALGEALEGASRPGHFAGVATVVTKLLNLVRPTHAYFGQKDAQQLAVIRRLARDLALPVDIVAGPTVREPDGLALSSRNAYLSPSERAAAPVLFRALETAQASYRAGQRGGDALRRVIRETVQAEPLAQIDYAEMVDATTMTPLAIARPGTMLVIAARFGATRLIDNLLL